MRHLQQQFQDAFLAHPLALISLLGCRVDAMGSAGMHRSRSGRSLEAEYLRPRNNRYSLAAVEEAASAEAMSNLL